jgi:SAM-dependent methyltransferase
MSDPATLEPTSEHFAAVARCYGALRGDPAFVGRTAELLAAAGDLAGHSVLDVGCGTGHVLRELVDRHGVRAIGVDRSPEMLAEARNVLGGDAELHLAPAERLPLEDGSVDRALMVMAAHLVERPRAFSELRRVLEPGGTFTLLTSDPEGMDGFWLVPFFPRFIEIDRERFPTGDTLAVELRAAGFDDVRVKRVARERAFDRATALAKVEGRAFSTFALMTDEEFTAGVEAARAGLPDVVRYTLLQLILTARTSRRSA